MNIYKHLDEIELQTNTVLTIGTFDGLHLGHHAIFNKLFERSRFHAGRSFLVTFHPHPRKVISKEDGLKILSTPAEKIEVLKQIGLENLLIINFTEEFSALSPSDFIKSIIVEKIGLREIVIGHDHKFGKGREGTHETLIKLGKELGFGVSIVDEYKINNETISSTKIRVALQNGDVRLANSFLGREYSFSGTVVEGDKRGRKLGYPTANIKLEDDNKLLPALGIYAVFVALDNFTYEGLLSIGRRPTFYNNGDIIPEVYIYNFDKDIYGKNITVNLVEVIRSEEKFSSAEELIAQMNKDKENGSKIFRQQSSNSERN